MDFFAILLSTVSKLYQFGIIKYSLNDSIG